MSSRCLFCYGIVKLRENTFLIHFAFLSFIDLNVVKQVRKNKLSQNDERNFFIPRFSLSVYLKDDRSIICLYLMLRDLCLLVLVCAKLKRIDLPLKWLVHLLVRYQEHQKSKFKTSDRNSTENALSRKLVKNSTFIWNLIGQCAWWPNWGITIRMERLMALTDTAI